MNTPPILVGACLLLGLLSWGVGYLYNPVLDSRTALGPQRIPEYTLAPDVTTADAALLRLPDGRTLYASACQACHQPSGRGLGKVFPALAASPRVLGDPDALILSVLNGMTSAVQLGDSTYQRIMPGFRDQLSDEAIAAVLSHVRSAWGNQAAPIDAGQVAQLRRQTAPGKAATPDATSAAPAPHAAPPSGGQ